MGLQVCPGCGVIAPTERSQCELCKAPFETPRTDAPERSDDRFWVRLRCRFRCRSCGRWTPLGYLDADGVVQCARCGMEQAYDVDVWRQGLEAAHAVGDLHGPDPEGRRPGKVSIAGRNPHADIGRSATCFESEQSGIVMASGVVQTRSLHLEAAPGHPLCAKCKAPLQAHVDDAGGLVTECGRCTERATYALPASTRALHDGFDGAIAAEYRTDRQDVRVRSSSQGGAIALECPNCSAALEVDGKSPIVTCEYCHTQCRIPSRTLAAIGQEAAAQPWWVLLRGPSEARGDLERQAEQEVHQRQIAAERQVEAEAARRFEQPKEKKGGSGLDRVVGLVVPLLVVGAVGVLGFRSQLSAWTSTGRAAAHEVASSKPGVPQSSPASGTAAAPAAGADSPAPADPAPRQPPPRSAFQSLHGCSCRANTDGKPGRELVQLAVYPEGKRLTLTSSGQRVTWKLQYYLDVADGTSYLLANDDSDVAPPYEVTGSRFTAGMACTDHVVVIAAAGHVTGWSTADGSRLWTTRVDGWSPSAGAHPDALTLECVPLHAHHGIVTVRETRGRATRIRIATGEVL